MASTRRDAGPSAGRQADLGRVLSHPVYLVIPARGISGAEKRFIGMWIHLQERGLSQLHLVTSREAFELACKTEELTRAKSFADRVVFATDHPKMRLALAPVLFRLWREDPRAAFHFVMMPPGPFELPYIRRSLFTIPDSFLEHFSTSGRAQLYLGTALARRVDMLDPVLFERFRGKLFRFKRSAISHTPNSFVDTELYRPAPLEKKTNTMTFLGRFHDEKQVDRLVETLPFVDRVLRENGVADPAYRILGNGDDAIVRRCEELSKTIDVAAYYEPNPMRVLATSKVFFSLQKSNNYPSKSLLEAMACGNVPVVTDVGTSRRIAPDELACYVPRDFTAGDIAGACAKALSMNEAELGDRVAAMRKFLDERFSMASMADYFVDIYRGLASR
ncbi:MAG: glycosyltransferase family 4 protein [Labilithrix sp.]|nr:glycosyltransferase family 4 protein [Labilithrix sp.]